ncbi:MAG: hypothetical protein AB7Q17_15840 [Phycisphaerae bacterium]
MLSVAPGSTLPRTPLAGIAMQYAMERERFIGLAVLPPFITDERAGERMVWSNKTGLGLANVDRAYGGEFSRVDDVALPKSFSCKPRGLERAIDLMQASELGRFIVAPMATAARLTVMQLMRAMEFNIAAVAFNPTLFAPASGEDAGLSFTAAGPKLNRDVAADVEAWIANSHSNVLNQCGAAPDTVVLSNKTYFALGRNTQVRARIISQFGDRGFTVLADGRVIPTTGALAELFQVKEVLVGFAKYDAAPEGKQLVTTDIWNVDRALWCVREQAQDLEMVQYGRTFVWGQWSGPNGEPFVAPNYPEPNRLSEVVQAYHVYEPQVFNPRAAYLWTGIDAP